MLRECKEMRENWEGKMKRIDERLKGIEEELKEVKEIIRIRENSSNRSECSERSEGGASRISSRWRSEWSVGRRDSGLSQKNIGKLRSMMEEKERYERSNNVKGVEIEKEGKIDVKWVEKFLEEVLDTRVKIIKSELVER